MRFDFCGNVDCPEWVLAEISLINRMSSVKIKLIMKEIVKKIIGGGNFAVEEQALFDIEKLQKICRDQKLSSDETSRLLAIIDFCVTQASKHDISDVNFNKDLTQMGVAIENANSITKSYNENQDQLVKSMKNQSMRVSSLEDMSYKLSFLMASSMTGKNLKPIAEGSEEVFQEPLDTQVTINLTLNEFPNEKRNTNKNIKFSTGRDKFLQFTRDIREAVEIMDNMKQFS